MFRKYWERNLSVIPVEGKNPGFDKRKWGQYCHTMPTEEEVEEWERLYKLPKYGVGIVFGPVNGDLGCVDIDSLDPELLDFLQQTLPPSPVRRIGRRAAWFYRMGQGVSNASYGRDNIGPDRDQYRTEQIEIFQSGKQIVLPPSIHVITGNPYYWETPDHLENFDRQDLPLLLREHQDKIDDKMRQYKNTAADGSPMVGTGRNNSLTNLIYAILCNHPYKSDREVCEEIVEYDRSKHAIPYFDDKKEEYYNNPLKFVKEHRKRLVKKGVTTAEVKIKPARIPEAVITTPKPIEFPEMTGTIRMFMDAILSISRSEQKQMALGAALAIAGTLSANRFFCEGRPVYTNLFVLLSARSSMGKNAPFRFIQSFLSKDGIGHNKGYDLLGMANYSSEATLAKRIGEQRTRLDYIDEFGKVFKGLANAGDHKSTIGEALKMLFNATDRFAGHEIKEGTTGKCKFPGVSLFGAIQHSTFSKHATPEILFDGLLARFLYFFDDLDAKWLGFQENSLSDDIIRYISNECLRVYPPAPLCDRDMFGNIILDQNLQDFVRTELFLEPGLSDYLGPLDKDDYGTLISHYRAGREMEGTIQGRRLEIARRIMYIIAISDGARTVTRDHFNKAYQLTLACEQQAMAIISPIVDGVAPEKTDVQAKNVLKLLSTGPKTPREIFRAAGISRKYGAEAILSLMRSGDIEPTKVPHSNGQVYDGYQLAE